jgi:AcrR family transcriptional regulator
MNNDDAGIPKKKRDREASRRRILQAGLEVFSELGYDGATTRMIADRAGLNESLLHRYFGNKEGLLVEVSKLSVETMIAEPPYPPQATLEEEIYQFINGRMEYEVRNKDFVRVIISRALADQAFHKKMMPGKMMNPADNAFMSHLKGFQKAGAIKRGVDVERLFFTVLAFGFSTSVIDRLLWKLPPEECRKRFRFFAKSIAEGVCP